MTWCAYLTHPEVRIDPETPVPEWRLSEAGRERTAQAVFLPFAREIRHIVSSAEIKAIDTAQVLAGRLGLFHKVLPFLHENDRSATGFLEPEEFERTADAFFAEPYASVRGWERAIDAQDRVVNGVRSALRHVPDSDPVLFAGHGAVGTLLMCHLMATPISRLHDQPRAGCWYCFEKSWLMTQAGRHLGWTVL